MLEDKVLTTDEERNKNVLVSVKRGDRANYVVMGETTHEKLGKLAEGLSLEEIREQGLVQVITNDPDLLRYFAL